MTEDKENNELKIIQQLLVAQLILSGATIRDIKKITGLSNDAIYKFLPKNFGQKNGKKIMEKDDDG